MSCNSNHWSKNNSFVKIHFLSETENTITRNWRAAWELERNTNVTLTLFTNTCYITEKQQFVNKFLCAGKEWQQDMVGVSAQWSTNEEDHVKIPFRQRTGFARIFKLNLQKITYHMLLNGFSDNEINYPEIASTEKGLGNHVFRELIQKDSLRFFITLLAEKFVFPLEILKLKSEFIIRFSYQNLQE